MCPAFRAARVARSCTQPRKKRRNSPSSHSVKLAVRHARLDNTAVNARHSGTLRRRDGAAVDGAADWHRGRPPATRRPVPRSTAALRSAHGPQGRQLPTQKQRPRPRSRGQHRRTMNPKVVKIQLPPAGQDWAAVDTHDEKLRGDVLGRRRARTTHVGTLAGTTCCGQRSSLCRSCSCSPQRARARVAGASVSERRCLVGRRTCGSSSRRRVSGHDWGQRPHSRQGIFDWEFSLCGYERAPCIFQETAWAGWYVAISMPVAVGVQSTSRSRWALSPRPSGSGPNRAREGGSSGTARRPGREGAETG